MATITTIDEYPVIWRDKYWKVVTACLVEIFNVESSGALVMVSSLRRDLEEQLSSPWQLLMYHEEALNTATILFAKHSLTATTAAILEQYETICGRLGWAPEDREDFGA